MYKLCIIRRFAYCTLVATIIASLLYAFAIYSPAKLHRACANGNLNLVRSLLASGHLNARIDELRGLGLNYPGNILTPLMWASRNGHQEIVLALLSSGAKVDIKDEFGRTALWLAAESGCADCIKHLFRFGADPNCTSNNGAPVLHVAVRQGSRSCVTLLIDAGADPNIVGSQGHEGQTALSEAVEKFDVELVRELVAAGADPVLATIGQHTLLEYVQVSVDPRMHDIQVLLRDYDDTHDADN